MTRDKMSLRRRALIFGGPAALTIAVVGGFVASNGPAHAASAPATQSVAASVPAAAEAAEAPDTAADGPGGYADTAADAQTDQQGEF